MIIASDGPGLRFPLWGEGLVRPDGGVVGAYSSDSYRAVTQGDRPTDADNAGTVVRPTTGARGCCWVARAGRCHFGRPVRRWP
jgi:hypothetical protein